MTRLMLHVLAGMAVGALVSGCAGGRHPHGMGAGPLIVPATVCPPQACDVQVKVWTDPAGVCRLQVSDDTIQVSRGRSPVLTWQLKPLNPADGYDYRFNAASGVAFKASSPITAQDFVGGNAVGHDKYRWRAVNGRARDFFYDVNLQRKGASGGWADCPVLDPRIVNDGP
ncbi:MAG TPA: hypothetical protein VIP10_00545 [Burkholderiaceae bacterium]